MATIFDEALDETASPASVSGAAPTVFHEAVAPKNTVFHEALAEPKPTVFHEAVNKPSIPDFNPSATPPAGVVPISGAAPVVVQHVPMPGYDKRVTAAVGDKLPDQPTVNQNLTVAPPVHPPGRTEAQAMEQASRRVNVNLPGDIRYAGTQVIQTSTGDSRAPTIIGRLDDPQNIKPIIPFSPEQSAEIQQRSQQHIAQHGDIQVARNAQAFEQYLGSMPRVDVNAPEQPQENGQIDTQGKTYQAQQLNRFVQANPPPMHLLEGMPPQQAAEFQNRLHQNLAPVGGLKYTPQEQSGAEAGKLPGRLKAAAATLMDLANIKTNQERRQQQEQQKVADLYGTDLSNQLARANPTVAEKLRESARKTFEKFDGTPADFGGKLIELGSGTAPFFIPYIGPLLGGLDIAGQAQIAAEDALKAQNPHGDLNDIHSRALLTAAAKGAWGALTAYVGLGGKGLKGVGAAGATGAAIEAGSEAIGHVGYGEPIDPAKIMEAGATMGLMHAVFHPQETGEGLIEAGKKGVEAIREKLRGKPEEGGATPSEAETKAAEYQPKPEQPKPPSGPSAEDRAATEEENRLVEKKLTAQKAQKAMEELNQEQQQTDLENEEADRRIRMSQPTVFHEAVAGENNAVDQRQTAELGEQSGGDQGHGSGEGPRVQRGVKGDEAPLQNVQGQSAADAEKAPQGPEAPETSATGINEQPSTKPPKGLSNESATPNGPEARGDNSQTQAQEENAVRGQGEEKKSPQATPASDADDAGVLKREALPDEQPGWSSELKQLYGRIHEVESAQSFEAASKSGERLRAKSAKLREQFGQEIDKFNTTDVAEAAKATEPAVVGVEQRNSPEPPKFTREWAQWNLDRIERERQEKLSNLSPEQRRLRGSSILEPEQLFYQGLIAAHDIAAKVKDFATWSKQMIDKLGEAIRPHLPTLWDHVRPRGTETATGIKNAQVDLERMQRGLPAAVQAAKRGFGQVWDQAMKEVEASPEKLQDELIHELKNKPRALTDREDALLLHRQIQLQNDFHNTADALVKAHADNDQAGIVENRIKSAAISDRLLDLYNVNKSSGTETGRGLNARKMMANEDFSLAAMETKKRAANDGRALTDQERKGIARLHDRIEQTQESLDEHEVAAKEKQGDLEFQHARAEINQEVTRDAADDKQAGRVRDIPAERRRIVASMDEAVKKGALPTDLRSYIRALARNFVASGVTERDALLDAVHGEVHKVVPEMSRRQTMDAISGYGDFKSLSKDEIDVKLRDLKGQMQQVGKLEDMSAGQAPMKTGVERRVPSDEERRLIQQVNETKKRLGIQTADPETQLKSALDSIKTRLGNQIKDLEHQIATGTKIVKDKTATPKDAESLKLEARRDELKKQFEDIFGKPQMSDEQRLKLATDAVQRSISEYERRIKEKDLFPGKKPANVPSGDAYKALLARRDALAEELKHLRDLDVTHQESSKETQLSDAIASLQKRIADGDVSAPDRKSTVDTQRISELKAQKGKLAEQLAQMRKNAAGSGPQDASKQQSLQKSIADLEQRIAAGDIAPRPQKATVDSQQTTELKARRDELQDRLNEMRKAARPKKTPDEIALQATKTRLKSNIADLAEKIAAGDFSKRAPREVKLDDEGLRLKAENERLKDIFHRDLVKDNLKKRTMAEKVQDTFIRWRRGFVLSSPITIAKLISAAGERMITTPTEEVAGYGFSRIVPGLAERAPREGGLSVRAEAKAITEGFTKGMIDSWRLLKTGKSDLDQVYGKDSGIPQHAIDFLGNIHGALKTVTKRNEFARSFQKRAEWSIRNGLDASDPMVQSRIALDAYKDANRSIFMQDNAVVSAYKRALSAFEQKQKDSGKPTFAGKATATTLRTLLPVVKVPTNIVAETMQYALGSVTGSVRLARAYAKGIETLKPDQADSIMRSLKKGSIGAATMALGYFAADKIGGYYQPGQKRDREDVKYGAVRAFGHDIPSYLVHNPLLECLQIGATIRRVADSRLRKKDQEPQGEMAGVKAAAGGVIKEVPFVREAGEVLGILDPRDRDKTLASIGAGVVVPQASQFVARQTDQDAQGNPIRRTPKGLVQNIEMGIPGLRQQVPREKIEKNTSAEKAVDVYLSNDSPAMKRAMEPVVLKKVLDAEHLKPEEQDKLLKDAGIAPPPELSITRELRDLNKKLDPWNKAVKEATSLARQADASPTPEAANYLKQKARKILLDAKPNMEDVNRQSALRRIHSKIEDVRKRVKENSLDADKGEALIRDYIEEAKAKKAA